MVSEDNNTNADNKMGKMFKITSVCRNDIIQVIEDRIQDDDELKALMMVKGVQSITDEEMKWIVSKMCDDFCNCCFWDNLEYRFRGLMKYKNGNR